MNCDNYENSRGNELRICTLLGCEGMRSEELNASELQVVVVVVKLLIVETSR